MQEVVEALILAAAWDLVYRQGSWGMSPARRMALDLILSSSEDVSAEDLRKATGVWAPTVYVMSKDRGWGGW